jgi:hypothetical protein
MEMKMRRFWFVSCVVSIAIWGLVNTGCTGDPVKILVRKHDTGVLALDGGVFHMHVMLAAGKDDIKQSTMLVSDRRIKVEEEYSITLRSPVKGAEQKAAEWKKDPKTFDYLVSWTINSDEHTKTQMAEKLKITVKETWKVEKVSDPLVTKTWTCTYLLEGGAVSISQKLAEDEVRNVVAPAREPIVKEIKAFVSSRQ